VSCSHDAVAWPDHEQWFARALRDPDRELLIARTDIDVGVLRFDRLAPADDWRVSINLAPSRRGRGLGRVVLAAGETWLREQRAVGRIIAQIASTNAASIRAFEAVGYVLVEQAAGWTTYEHRP
jgi:RimJ/RimL family protein N-acetyltransferase